MQFYQIVTGLSLSRDLSGRGKYAYLPKVQKLLRIGIQSLEHAELFLYLSFPNKCPLTQAFRSHTTSLRTLKGNFLFKISMVTSK